MADGAFVPFLEISNLVLNAADWPQISFNASVGGIAIGEDDLWKAGSYQDVKPSGSYIVTVCYNVEEQLEAGFMDGKLYVTAFGL